MGKIFANNLPNCPVKAIKDLFVTYPMPTDSLLFNLNSPRFPNQQIAHRERFRTITVQLLQLYNINTDHLKSHSFRQGGASAAIHDTPVWIVQRMGRWKSSAWENYAFLDDHLIAQAMYKMTKAPRIPANTVGRIIYDDFIED